MTERERLPVIVLTGPLGSGKTTLLNRLLRQPAMAATAVVINEIGAVPIDHLLVEHSTENLVLLDNGCLCCTVRGDLVAGLRDLAKRRLRGEIPPFDRVVIETTGLADPGPIVHSLMSDVSLVVSYRLGGILAVFDAVNGAAMLDGCPEATKQAAMADLLLISKADLAEGTARPALERRLDSLAPGIERLPAVRGDIPAARVLAACDGRIPRHGIALPVATHGDAIRTHCFLRDGPMPWDTVAWWLDALAIRHGPALLRVKGIVDVAESPGQPLVVHGIHHLFHPPEPLPGWPDADRRTRIVFITRDLSHSVIEDVLAEAEVATAGTPNPAAA